MSRILSALCALLCCSFAAEAMRRTGPHLEAVQGANFCVERDFEGRVMTVAPAEAQGRPMKFAPADVHFTQKTCGGKGRGAKLLEGMTAKGWQPGNNPIDVVLLDGHLVTLDNTRVAVAQQLKLSEISGCVHAADDPLPDYYIESSRFLSVTYDKVVPIMTGFGLPDWTKVEPTAWNEQAKRNEKWQGWAKDNVARTWGQAVRFRWRNNKINNIDQAKKTKLNLKAEQTTITTVVSDESSKCLKDGVCSGEGVETTSQTQTPPQSSLRQSQDNLRKSTDGTK
jgi:hypothetical protein